MLDLTFEDESENTMTQPTHPGITRSLQRIADSDGFVLVCAVDHLAEFEILLGPVGSVPYAEIVEAKEAVVRAVAGEVSAVLLDPDYGIGHLVASGAVPPHVGIVASLEAENYEFPDGPRGSILREGWTPADAAAAGADALKFLWFYRPDLDPTVASAQRSLLTATHRAAAAAGIPLIVEPIWYAVQGEDTADPAWLTARAEGIVASASEVTALGCDVLKVEFPGSVATADDRAAAEEVCRRLDAAITVPWVILSAGVSFDAFLVQVEIACRAGASGYMAGRSVWGDVVTQGSTAIALERIRALNAVTRRHGRPLGLTVPLDRALDDLPRGWYRRA
ncbi:MULTISPECIES: tagatose 1,6-diphosphate aldolase [Microbacterium]|uniref:tagatose 1,6-diphosphate aldolase n=1 Tax=Microbacterium TaxID=33882 RepID=UPI00278B6362|nr:MULTISPECIES: tagatose 1,6-diphosphate aldolase [Microbacterium]MDQ1085360.1 tagatose 1,6-diphosphate aldolase [Microbacterium sp. SORGH_AS_0344]MDQ1169335.1 tagatose 1,6-diphosphate aldolase [Microbacterium proteolyticum]